VTVPPRIEVHDTSDALASAVAGELISRLSDAQAAGRVPQIVLTGGTIAEAIHREVGRLAAVADVELDWSQVVVWWGDERYVAPESEDRNAGQARAAFLDTVGLDPAKVHEMASTADAPDVEAGASAYAAAVRDHAADGAEFDVLMLGLGPDGHIASLFPGFPQLDVTDELAVPVTGSPKPPPERISLTLPTLNRARSVWFLVSGDGKAEAVAASLADGTDVHDTPGAGVAGVEETIWFLDRDAASRL
jgi:6-phosphogluconolactonase